MSLFLWKVQYLLWKECKSEKWNRSQKLIKVSQLCVCHNSVYMCKVFVRTRPPQSCTEVVERSFIEGWIAQMTLKEGRAAAPKGTWGFYRKVWAGLGSGSGGRALGGGEQLQQRNYYKEKFLSGDDNSLWSGVRFLRCSESADFISSRGLVSSWPETWASLTLCINEYKELKYIGNKIKSGLQAEWLKEYKTRDRPSMLWRLFFGADMMRWGWKTTEERIWLGRRFDELASSMVPFWLKKTVMHTNLFDHRIQKLHITGAHRCWVAHVIRKWMESGAEPKSLWAINIYRAQGRKWFCKWHWESAAVEMK